MIIIFLGSVGWKINNGVNHEGGWELFNKTFRDIYGDLNVTNNLVTLWEINQFLYKLGVSISVSCLTQGVLKIILILYALIIYDI